MRNISITDYLKNKNNLLPNLDPDGFFSYVLINHFIKSNIVGFTNSRDYVYFLKNIGSISGHTITYVDMFVTNPSINSIDQHIITRDKKETEEIKKIGTKLNPNIIFNQDLTDYTHKFPLSTFHFLLLLFAEEYDIKIDWYKKINNDLELGHLLLDIDGVLTNLRDYNANVKSWLEKLKAECKNKKIVNELYDYINTIPMLELKSISDRVRQFYKENFKTETKDGGFKGINSENINNIKNIIQYFSNILFNEKLDLDFDINSLEVWCGDYNISESKDVNRNNTFSYAIVRSYGKNFSYTNKLKRIN